MMTLLSLAGFIGSIRRSISSLRLYARGLGFALIVSLAIDALYIWAAFTTSHADFVQRCINGSTDQKTIDACNSKDAGTIVKVLVVVVAVITLGVQIWATVITSQYGDKLLEEQAWRANIVGGPRDVPVPMTGSGGKYASAPLDEARAPLTGATYAYPYTDSSNSHGQAYDPPQHGV
ncbi:hypothetical protein FA95DRAFT_1552789 [Auriscalpium vulgare]|uniref:Uncharacterized protein n=1 Tax=Auriscalpium vulgare TaxID=40419 RepID=A0ACB8SBR9_9AGAM|nr:hypothetical protein FA95DRAFT_1552789 [Auriscalpium vulgare]